jgi:zinc/manganese transport system permease protein
LADFQLLTQFHFMQNALVVGTLVALMAGAVGYFVVLRGQAFAAHMLSQAGFPGAAGAVLVHVAPGVGLLSFCLAAAIGLGAAGDGLGSGSRRESAAVGSILAFSIALGVLFTRLFAGSAQAVYAFLFGTILGITDADVLVAALSTAAALLALAVMYRPLLFASIDADVAVARGVPVRAVSMGFLVVLAVTVAQSVQVVGTLLIFALLVAPAATALRLSSRPRASLALSVALALCFTWLGLALAYFSNYPVGFFITSLAFLAYLGARAVRA